MNIPLPTPHVDYVFYAKYVNLKFRDLDYHWPSSVITAWSSPTGAGGLGEEPGGTPGLWTRSVQHTLLSSARAVRKQACARETWTLTLETSYNFYLSGNNRFSSVIFSAHRPYKERQWAGCGPWASFMTLVLEHYPHWVPYWPSTPCGLSESVRLGAGYRQHFTS